MENENNNLITLPVLPLRGLVVFPKSLIHFDVGRTKSIAAIKKAMESDQLVFLVAQKDVAENDPDIDGIYKMGVVAKIIQVLKQPDNTNRIVIEGKFRAEIVSSVSDNDCLIANVVSYPVTKHINTSKDTALMRAVKEKFEEYVSISPKMPSDIIFKVATCNTPGEMSDYIASNILLDYPVKQMLLEEIDESSRIEMLLDVITNENYIINIEHDVMLKAKNRIDKNQKEYFLREQKRIIEEELGEDDNPSAEAEEYAEAIEDLMLDEKSEEYLLKECRKLMRMSYGSQETSVIRTYLDTVLDLPWHISTKDKISISKLRKELDKSHYGLVKVKERIIEQLAVTKLKKKSDGQIICFAGPPGVGKTSVAQSIAKAIGRNSQRIALGGVRDEAEIRGHRRTYIGSIPGRIMTAIQNAGSNNPVLILDEIDKLASDYKGDPASALLEVLDSEQNNKFCDHYIDIPFDLSNVMFITTANDISSIPAPLRDRMEIIEIESYTREEKFNIAKKHLVPKQIEKCGFDTKEIKFTSSALYHLIDFYTREAGVRTLERLIGNVIRKCAVKKLEEDIENFKISDKEIEELLGHKKYITDKISQKDEIGVVNGLAWTSVGGELLPIEVAVMSGTGKIELTGSLGDVMQESAKIAITCVRSHSHTLDVNSDFYKTKDIHIHAPEGAVPKDGPSAGITMATAIFSALTGKPVRKDVAMTGEITLRGKVMPIGGLKEKSMAAYKSGIKTVIIPKENEPDLQDVDQAVKEKINFIPVESFSQVISNAISDVPVISEKEWNTIPSENLAIAQTVRQ